MYKTKFQLKSRGFVNEVTFFYMEEKFSLEESDEILQPYHQPLRTMVLYYILSDISISDNRPQI